MAKFLKILLFAPLKAEANFMFERTAGITETLRRFSSRLHVTIFPKLSEIYTYRKMSRNNYRNIEKK